MTGHHGTTARRSAFTLIELLVVIAIIALLVTLLVPALEAAKRQAKVVTCASNVRTQALGLAIYAEEDGDGFYPWSTWNAWAVAQTIWASTAEWNEHISDGEAYLDAYRDTVCGGNWEVTWCALWMKYGNIYTMLGGDPNYPELWYDERWGYRKYMSPGYFTFANCWGADYTFSGNSVTDGPPPKPGSSRDAIITDVVWATQLAGEAYQCGHATGFTLAPEDAVRFRNENCVGYGDGHAEIHGDKGYFEGGWFTWDGAKYIGWGPYRCPY